jgi:undecaprenyl diphosphate synthase
MTTPQHIAIIMDGNRRWARERGLDVVLGHKKMAEEGIKNVVDAAAKLGVKYLTLWALSTENWNRDAREVAFLMELFRSVFTTQAAKLHQRGVRIRTIGDLSRFDRDIQDNIQKWTAETSKNTGITVVFALNYGGRDEILRAVQKITHDVTAGKRTDDKLTEAQFAQYLDTAGLPDPELIIRPGGEQRMSGYLLWQSNYAEFYFTPTLMPDFGEAELVKAIEDFNNRQRRFGR